MPLYHACHRSLPLGSILAVPDGDTARAYNRSLMERGQWFEDAFEQARCGRSKSRRVAIYGCDRPELAARFALSEGGTMPKVYEVDMPGARGSPMTIVDYLARKGPSFVHVETALEEYWEPTRPWKFLEYLASAATILRSVPVEEMAVFAAMECLEHDRRLSRSLWDEPSGRL